MEANTMLVLGRSEAVLNEILTIVLEDGFDAVGTVNNKEAAEYLKSEEFQYFMVAGGVLSPDRERLISLAKALKIKVLEPEQGARMTKEVLHKLLAKTS